MENEKIKKTSRASQTRDKVKKPVTWTPPSSLDAPPAPNGSDIDGLELKAC